MKPKYQTICIGGGAAGYFAAINLAEKQDIPSVAILEQGKNSLAKVKISGGGRCNVTHACFEPKELVKNYPRGHKELLGPFYAFQPQDTIEWYGARGVELHAEEDGRMFPITNSSQTIIDCLEGAAQAAGVDVCYEARVAALECTEGGFQVTLASGAVVEAETIVLATGSSRKGHSLVEGLGHSIVDPLPSLFTFNTPDSPLLSLSGASVPNATISLPEVGRSYQGPLLITHWGFSGPGVLKLSAWAAIELAALSYTTVCEIDWVPSHSIEELRELFLAQNEGKSVLHNPLPLGVPKKLWAALAIQAGIADDTLWSAFPKKLRERFLNHLKRYRENIQGKTGYKQEFVTCGGVDLREVSFKTMESTLVPGLFFAGEVLNIDGITGGFNFQAAWTTGWIAARGISQKADSQ